MPKITFILGGARSGKSAFALKLAGKFKRNVAFIATGQALDQEMSNRIKLHKKNRPKHIQTFEELKDIDSLMQKIGNKFDCIIIDCITLLVSNLFLAGKKESGIENRIKATIRAIKKSEAEAIIISNELGLGIVPDNQLGREFRDIAGRINQIIAESSNKVYFMVSGIPAKIK